MTTFNHWTVYRQNTGDEETIGWTNESQARAGAHWKEEQDNCDAATYVQSDERPDPAKVLDDE